MKETHACAYTFMQQVKIIAANSTQERQVFRMPEFEILNAGEQVARHLREELARGVWTGVMPGEDRLMKRLGVGRATIKAALKQLEEEGVLVDWGIRGTAKGAK